MGKTLLNVGCGDHKIPNFINVDINPNADICFDVRKGLPFKNSSIDGIYSEHFIEHLSQSNGISFFRECRRVLKSSGCIRIATPDLDYITKRYFSENWFKDPDLKRFGYEWVNNPCEQINISMREWGHKWLYNEEELTRIASYAGFKKFKRFNIGISDNSDFANLEYRASSRLIVEFYKIEKPILEKNPLVSILIPAYNSNYFEDAIKSAINQTYENIEIIIGDDNPTSNKIFKATKKYANNNDKIQYYKNPTNLNAKVNMIKLFDSAKGDYIKFLNDDDILHPTCVERMVHFLNNFPNVTLVTSHRQRIDHHGNNLKDIPETTRPVTDDSIIDGVSMANMMLYTGKNFIGEPTTVMFRKSDLLDSKPNFLSFAGREAYAIVDQTMWVNLLSRGDAIYLIDTLSYFRIHPEQRQQQKSFFPTIAPAISQLRFDAKRMGFLRKYDKIKLHTKPLSSNENSRIGNCNSDIIYLQPNDKVKSNNTISARAKCIAFYLPQYHPIPENNIWWGEGFTEWTNVTKAKPLYDGHYQPHLPANLGFYDLRVPETREAQAKLAKDHGIYGFCYYHYWFNGKRLLERPFQEILSSGEPSFPFCLCWANENWTRAWDGRQGEVLIKQNYSEKDDRDHIKYLLNIFKDKRYIRIKGRPLMLIYLSTRLPNAKRTIEIWREEAQKQGEELYICKVESAPYEYGDPSKSGFDASVEFQPDWGNLGPLKSQLSDGHHLYDYSNVVKRMLNKPIPTYKRYPCVTPMWDNSPRRKKSSLILDNSTPEAYELWLSETVSSLNNRDLDDDIIFINAWNEWGEGNHLEPDRRHGLKYLESTKKVLNSSFSYPSTKSLVSIIILTYNQLEYSKLCVNSIIENTEIPYEIIFVDNGSLDGTVKWLKDLCKRHPNFRLIKNVTNKGFAVGCNQGIEAASGEYILLLNNDVIVTPNWLTGMLNCIKSDIKSGIVGPMTNNISGSQRVPRVTYKSPDDLPAYAKQFYKNHRYRRILNQRIVGFCMLFHRNLVERIGMLDASFGTGNFEDDDFCLRSVLHGYHNYIAADVFIHHFGSRSFIGNNIDYQDVLNNNKTLFLDKWSVVKRDDPLFEELFLVNCAKRADELINLGLYDKAEKRLLDGIRRLPGRHKLVYKLADCLLDSNCYEDAMQLIGAIPHSNLTYRRAYYKGALP
jgi:GT2 family glycosyltransferase/predicted SAM-dependent methyltransferase